MVYLKGIFLYDTRDSVNELHKQANAFGISKTWFNLKPVPHYNIINAIILDGIIDHFNKQNKKGK